MKARPLESMRIGIAAAIISIGGGAWWLSALYADVQALKVSVAEVKADVKSLLKQGAVAESDRKTSSAKCAVNLGPYGVR